MNNLRLLYNSLLLLGLPMIFACSPSEKTAMEEYLVEETKEQNPKPSTRPKTSFNEENWSTDYSNIQVSIGEIQLVNEAFVVEVKVMTKRENYHIEILGNLSDGKGNITGSRTDSFYGPDSFEHTFRFEKVEGFLPHLLLLSIYNPIDGNWNDLTFTYFDNGEE
ncbi:hypothetical protein [Rhodonellum sp.]|uniref:hypothetical protein n=1 Tax=Rhodonellum sp. TaxID=2231180 RepID=UPI00272067BF|nr:hypothetical protein [Rhodonellum sp.]MDO9551528.1 hypothetical protein [Rhodonellum sp.]